MSSNISLQIEKGKGISHAIDAALDKELNQDVKLNLSQWQSVFDIVKNDNATEKQYTGGDDDITDGKQYVVRAGSMYQITQNAWTQIVNIARNSLGLPEEVAEPEEVVSAETADAEENADKEAEVKQTLTDILRTANIEFTSKSETYQARLITQYNNMTALATQNNQEIDRTKIIQYAKALEYREAQDEWANAAVSGTESSTVMKFDASIAKYRELGKGEISLADSDGDGKISKAEFISYEMESDGVSERDEEGNRRYEAAFAKLDKSGDGYIDATEEATNIYTTATILDYKGGKSSIGDITAKEYETAQIGLVTTKEEAEQALNSISLETTKTINDWAKEHGHNPTADELDQIPFKNIKEKMNYLQWYSYETYNSSDSYYQNFKTRENQ